ncbi:UDP-N-acetylmuramate dehydrogenase [Gilvimarinus algae]|uniref:UDP-N-acetylenolpyruvoylglucosamine reductase n=1 Tax=Gilvimarinus algae TaxID=3058037 RepID=A0ABT8TJ67_9GAMM|nr:UDP-N-acetylmuramate dehydrogenase [Gilvimarinus sp. SDUM040014]MDO3382706.1 UDP-N-acetylmuramate dehydrogenase [Gilvimarinus sp. SDUM040014]
MALVLPEFDLARFNTLASPARARAYMSVASREELVEALQFAREHSLPILPLGGGSNIVLREDFPGLVVHIKMRGIELVHETQEHLWVRAQAGENWHEFVLYCLAMGWYGLENLSLIPGSVGAAPIQNIGAYGVELDSVFAELTALEVASRLAVTFDGDGCGFGYRDSVFKQRLKDQYIICDVTFKLNKTAHLRIDYPALAERLAAIPRDALTAEQVSAAVCAIRREKLPDPETIPNAGSFFKNPVVPANHFEALRSRYPDIVGYPQADGKVKLAAAWLIDRAGWKGVSEGNVAVHSQQALVLTNPGRAYGEELLFLAERIRASVRQTYDVELEIEPRIYP